ncbi:MAG: HAD family phosphatase [Rhodoferax sp.]|nr:HAD family phosphatase [Rhodoferax sp.]
MNIVFDFGAVLFAWKPAEMLAHHFPREAATAHTAAALARSVFSHTDWHNFDRGTLTSDDVVQRTSQRLNLDQRRLETLVGGIGEHLEPMPETLAVLKYLHEHSRQHQGVRLYYLSNMPEPYARVLEQRHPFLQWFDGGIFSSDVLQIKPEAAIYQSLQARYALEPERTLLIDDLLANVQAAQQQDWQGIHFHSASQLQAELVARNLYPAEL